MTTTDQGVTRPPLDPAAIMAAHKPTPVHQYDDVNGVFVYGADDELVTLHQLCEACTPDHVLEALGDCQWTEDEPGVYWPCDAHSAAAEAVRLAVALTAAQEREQRVVALRDEWRAGAAVQSDARSARIYGRSADSIGAALAGEGAANQPQPRCGECGAQGARVQSCGWAACPFGKADR